MGGTTDSFGPDLRPMTTGLALLPYGNGVHDDAEPQRRPLPQRLVGDGTLPRRALGRGVVVEERLPVRRLPDVPGQYA